MPKLIDYIYPLGSVIASTNSKFDPNSAYKHQMWVRFAQGRTLVGVNTSDSDFKTAEKIGGERTHKLTASELPALRPAILAHSESGNDYSQSGADLSFEYSGSLKGWMGYGINQGGDEPHNNMQPYVTVYYWKRTK